WLSGPDQAALEPLALDGQHWMLTPWRTVEVVHAVQRPLIAPEMVKLAIHRGRNDTAAGPRFVATCSLKSTDRMDLLAEWHEPNDDPSQKIATDRARGDTAFSIKVTDPASYSQKIHSHARGGIPEHTVPGLDLLEASGFEPDLVMPNRPRFRVPCYRRIN